MRASSSGPSQPTFPSETIPLTGRPWRTFRDAVEVCRSSRPARTGITRATLDRKAWSATARSRMRARDASTWQSAGLTSPRRAGSERRPGSTDVFGRLWWDRPAFTIRTEFYKPEKGRYLHPSEHRPITVREAARCMSFPDSFEFPRRQSMTSVAKQIGNAVPPDLASAIAAAIGAHLMRQAAG